MLSFLYVYSHHSILECYNLFSGVQLSMRSFCVISETFQFQRKVTFVSPGANLTLFLRNSWDIVEFAALSAYI